MKISDLAAIVDSQGQPGGDIDIDDLAYDSRQVKPGSVFFAVPGTQVDGHLFIDQAVENGAIAVVVERLRDDLTSTIIQLKVEDSRHALAQASDKFFGSPSRKIKLIGVTGTNGKTTTAYLLESIFRRAGFKTGLIGTIDYQINGTRYKAERTTPESLDLQRLLARMVESGVQIVALEVSSHALQLKRIEGCRFAARVFTNLSRDHLDFHKDFEEYFQSKARLFSDTAFGTGMKLVNTDDPYGRRVAEMEGSVGTITLGLEGGDYQPVDINCSVAQTSFTLKGPRVEMALKSRLLGAFNVLNLAVSAAIAFEMGVATKDIEDGVWGVASVPGRFESVSCGQDFQVLVDYAHTPDGLEKVLSAAKHLAGQQRLITVFGCGGDRDRGKRPKMGAIGARLSDLAIVTSDNPRSEAPQEIIEEVMGGIPKDAVKKTKVVVDRADAIRQALAEAAPGDVVVIAGKGHEDYQILSDKVISFDDRLIAAEMLREIVSGPS